MPATACFFASPAGSGRMLLWRRVSSYAQQYRFRQLSCYPKCQPEPEEKCALAQASARPWLRPDTVAHATVPFLRTYSSPICILEQIQIGWSAQHHFGSQPAKSM